MPRIARRRSWRRYYRGSNSLSSRSKPGLRRFFGADGVEAEQRRADHRCDVDDLDDRLRRHLETTPFDVGDHRGHDPGQHPTTQHDLRGGLSEFESAKDHPDEQADLLDETIDDLLCDRVAC